ncbi:MAG: hypothetical protein WCS55_08615 [Sulfuricurvum sp.]|uniref:hypothetical protein n=1 Tax=Sulfuricurvum sp. TaxID=2025608 RepID=UPI002635D651|nr:hypothetical protein [uncultured Sulfuricurvum sp.]
MDKIYQRIGEFVVSYQWIENQLREIGWIIINPNHQKFPQMELREESSFELFQEFEKLFLEALSKCQLPLDLENDFRSSLKEHKELFHNLRKSRNNILHSAYLELKGGDEVLAIVRSNPKINKKTMQIDNEILTEKSFTHEMQNMSKLALFLGRCKMQLIHCLPRD